MQNRNLLKKIALVAVIILLAGLPFIVREVRKDNANTNEPTVEQSVFDVAEFIEVHHKEVRVWQEERNRLGGSMKWQFNSKNARIKLKKLYPYI